MYKKYDLGQVSLPLTKYNNDTSIKSLETRSYNYEVSM